jgi:hypothetical protein
MISSSTTETRDREEWRARILRALAELDTAPPGISLDRRASDDDSNRPRSTPR